MKAHAGSLLALLLLFSLITPSSAECPDCAVNCVKHNMFYSSKTRYDIFVFLTEGGWGTPALCDSTLSAYLNVANYIAEGLPSTFGVLSDPCVAMIVSEKVTTCNPACSAPSCTNECCYAPDIYARSLEYDYGNHRIEAEIINVGKSTSDAFNVTFKVNDVAVGQSSVSELNFLGNWMSHNKTATRWKIWDNYTCVETYTLSVEVDSTGDIPEKNETNNYRTINVTIKPDYTVTLDYTPMSPDYGDDVNITAHIGNRGPIAPASVNLTFTVNGAEDRSLTISPPGYLEMVNITHPIYSIGSGTYNITAIVYPNETCGDLYEANNNATEAFTVGEPELYIEYFSCVDNCDPVMGQNFTIGFAAHLAGPDSLPGPRYVKLFRDRLGFPIELETWTIGYPNASNSSVIVNYTLGYGSGYLSSGVPGLWNFSLEVDPYDTLDESNEGNNRRNLSVYVQSLPDFSVDNSTITFSRDNLTEGYTTVISAVVENTGNYTKDAWVNFSYCPAGDAEDPCSYCSVYPHNVFTNIGADVPTVPGNGEAPVPTGVPWTPDSSQKYCIRVFVNATYIPGVDIYWEPSYTAYTDVEVRAKPDIKPLNIAVSDDSPTQGCNITVSSNITNTGESYNDFVQIALYEGGTGDQCFVKDIYYPKIDKEEVIEASMNVTVNPSFNLPHIYVDAADFINESNETNNYISANLNVRPYDPLTVDTMLNISLIQQEDTIYSVNAPTCWQKVLFQYSNSVGSWYNRTVDENSSDGWSARICDLTHNISSGQPDNIKLRAVAYDAAGNTYTTDISYVDVSFGWNISQRTIDGVGDATLANGTEIWMGYITDDQYYIYLRVDILKPHDIYIIGIVMDTDNNMSTGDEGYEYDISWPYYWWVEEWPAVVEYNGSHYSTLYNLTRDEYCRMGEVFQFKIPKRELNISDTFGLYYWILSDYNYDNGSWVSRDTTPRENYTLLFGTPPIISGVGVVNVTNESAVILWNTSEPGDSVVEYGLTGEYGKEQRNNSRVMEHSITLPGLSPDNTYYYLINSTDDSNNSDTNTGSFMTAQVYYETTMDFPADGLKTVNASEANVTLEIVASKDLSNMQVTVSSYSNNPENTSFSVPGISKFIQINVNPLLAGNISSVYLTLSYDETEANTSNVNESTLGFYWLNETNGKWLKLNASAMDWVFGEGVNTSQDYVWANVSHLSTYTVGGSALSTSAEILVHTGWNLISLPLNLS